MHGSLLPPGYLKPIGTPLVYLNQSPGKQKGCNFDQKGEDGTLGGFNPKLLLYCIVSSSGAVILTKHV